MFSQLFGRYDGYRSVLPKEVIRQGGRGTFGLQAGRVRGCSPMLPILQGKLFGRRARLLAELRIQHVQLRGGSMRPRPTHLQRIPAKNDKGFHGSFGSDCESLYYGRLQHG